MPSIILGDKDKNNYRGPYSDRPRRQLVSLFCLYCKEFIVGHRRCVDCKVMTHLEIYNCDCGKAHTLTLDGVICVDCKNYRENGLPEYKLSELSTLIMEQA